MRSRSIFGTIGASLQTILGGNITLLTNLCEKTRPRLRPDASTRLNWVEMLWSAPAVKYEVMQA